MKDVIGLLVELSSANDNICKQKNIIDKLQAKIVCLENLEREKDREIKHLAMEIEKLENDLADSKNNGANLLIKQIIDDIVESGLVKLEVEE